MIRGIFIFFIVLSSIGCNVNKKVSIISSKNFNKKNESSISAKYLTANYSIRKGDVHTASEILDSTLQNPKLLEIKFFSNLVSGKFVKADKVSTILKTKNPENNLYNLPKYILKIKKNDFKGGLEVFRNQKKFFNLNNLNDLIKLWINSNNDNNKTLQKNNYVNTSIHKLLILENFHDSTNLIEIADVIYENHNLNSHDSLLLAGFYFRVGNIKKTNKVINTKLSDQFDKSFIIKSFLNKNNNFKNIQKLDFILASKIFNMINENKLDVYKSHSYKKIMLEFSLFLDPKMDISRYTLAEIYNKEKTTDHAIKNLDSISNQSFFSLAAHLKKLSIIKTTGIKSKYEILLFKIFDFWPENKFVLHRLANYYKSKKQYYKSIKIYEKILNDQNSNDRDLFLYASNLDKIGKWKDAKVLFRESTPKTEKSWF